MPWRILMTHDKLLAKVSNYKDAGLGSLVALRAVVELHKPEHSITGYRCTHCTLEVTYPCPTIQAIEKELS
jgi:hypothetical protein